MALGDIHLCFTLALRALGWLWWGAWTGLVAGDAAALWMAGLALGDIYFRFAWRAWHLGHWAGSGGALGLDWSPVTPRHCVAGVAIGVIHLRFTWQAWHLVTSAFVLRGRRGTLGTGLALVARLDRIGRR